MYGPGGLHLPQLWVRQWWARPCRVCAKANLPPDSSGSRTGPRGRKRATSAPGWEQTEDYEGLDLPDDDFDYDDFIAREFGNKGREM